MWISFLAENHTRILLVIRCTLHNTTLGLGRCLGLCLGLCLGGGFQNGFSTSMLSVPSSPRPELGPKAQAEGLSKHTVLSQEQLHLQAVMVY